MPPHPFDELHCARSLDDKSRLCRTEVAGIALAVAALFLLARQG
jgi:hypothetical protein